MTNIMRSPTLIVAIVAAGVFGCGGSQSLLAFDMTVGGASSCEGELIFCNSACVDPRSDAMNCGGCEIQCPVGANLLSHCQGGVCVSGCVMGFEDCDASPANGCEVDLRSDGLNCGACDKNCEGGECVARECRPGLIAEDLPSASSEIVSDGSNAFILSGLGANSQTLYKVEYQTGKTTTLGVYESSVGSSRLLDYLDGYVYVRNSKSVSLASVERVSTSGGSSELLLELSASSSPALAVGPDVFYYLYQDKIWEKPLVGDSMSSLFWGQYDGLHFGQVGTDGDHLYLVGTESSPPSNLRLVSIPIAQGGQYYERATHVEFSSRLIVTGSYVFGSMYPQMGVEANMKTPSSAPNPQFFIRKNDGNYSPFTLWTATPTNRAILVRNNEIFINPGNQVPSTPELTTAEGILAIAADEHGITFVTQGAFNAKVWRWVQ